MGLFDTINVEHDCHNCNYTLDHYQTKALDSCMIEYKLGDKIELADLEVVIGSFEIHDFCTSCSTSISGRGYVKDQILWRVTEYREGEEVVVAEYLPS